MKECKYFGCSNPPRLIGARIGGLDGRASGPGEFLDHQREVNLEGEGTRRCFRRSYAEFPRLSSS
jgi:hypothetical protein